jgi:hypothetical protein
VAATIIVTGEECFDFERANLYKPEPELRKRELKRKRRGSAVEKRSEGKPSATK